MAGQRVTPTPSKIRRTLLGWCVAGAVVNTVGFVASAQATRPKLDVPFGPSPPAVVDRMLELARVSKNDLLYDLGSGDGRIVIAAAKKYGVRAIGIDLDPERVAEARVNAKKAGVEDQVQFVVGDIFKSDFSDATVVTLFLWPQVNLRLRPHLWRQLAVGTRVVSHLWDMGAEWPPDHTELVGDRRIFYWTITAAHKKAAENATQSRQQNMAALAGH